MTLPRIICICGMMHSGKDILADYFVQKYNYEKISFAKPLKQAVSLLFDLQDDQIYGEKKDVIDERWKTTPRQIMQIIGTDMLQFYVPQKIMPHIGRHFWTHKLINTIQKNPEKKFVINDLRFYHEYKILKNIFQKDIYFIKIKREQEYKRNTHISEQEIENINCDIEIQNYFSQKQDLYHSFENIIHTKNKNI